MAKNIIVSNRLPIRISKVENSYKFEATSGGLATGMKTIHEQADSLWVGWPGIGIDEIEKEAWIPLEKDLISKAYSPVRLDKEEVDNFYYGLANKCLWPLFHYFIEYSIFSESHWASYVAVNQKFADRVLEDLAPGDTVWIHDYQLLLCPQMIRAVRPDVTIGFFLHIPFPSFEIFRIFPWREELLKGMLGADLIGFHTYDYERHFLSSVKRILRLDVAFNRVTNGLREVVVNTFPMGIDYEKFHRAAQVHLAQKSTEQSELKRQLELHKKGADSGKLILSIDRLDYTKGVVNRIKAFDLFLTKYPEYLEKVRLLMLTVPSRSDVPEYMRLKKETDEVVGRINGKYATVNWTPVWYYYRAMSFDDLIDLYMTSDIAMITPVRDGMNLVAKEFVATRVSGDGVLILSEMAGASKELFEALLVNPFDKNAMADTLHQALTMPVEEQIQRNTSMQKRLSRYTVAYWANEFTTALHAKADTQEENEIPKVSAQTLEAFASSYAKASKRLLILDYDGTLVPFNEKPALAVPSPELLDCIKTIAQQPNTDLAIVSGRDQAFLDKWFAEHGLILVAEHGHYRRTKNEAWKTSVGTQKDWIDDVLPIFQAFTDRTPGTFIEEKHNSLVWHYRKTDPELAAERVVELNTVLSSLISDQLTILDMDKALEVIDRQVNKGTAVAELYANDHYDFVLCLGDDVTDEHMFVSLPDDALTVKVGRKPTAAKYYIEDVAYVNKLLVQLTQQ